MSDIGVAGIGAYVPYWRLKRSTIAEAWGIPAMPGERSAAAADEDAVTMAVEAAVTACEGVDPKTIDGVIFASTTAPYREKQIATIVAAVLDCRPDILTLDIGDSLRGATTAIRVAADAIRAGSARSVVVCAADARMGEPESSYEQMFGDAGGAVLLASAEWSREHGSGDLPLTLDAAGGVAQEFLGPWRRESDRFVRSFEAKVEVQFGYAEQAVKAAKSVLEEATPRPAVIAAPDPRSQAAVAKALGVERVHDLYFGQIGNMGTSAPLVMLAGALEEAQDGERILVVGAGDGADALVFRVTAADRQLGALTPYLESKGYLDSYETYARNRKLVERERAAMWSSAVIYWRDLPMELPLYGMTCQECGTVQYPIGKRCMECSAKGPHDNVRLERRGRIFTFTLDHLVLGEYWNEPVPRAVVDLEGGGRLFCEVTDCDPDDVHVEMPVELTFRCLHEGGGFRNYYWKARPVRGGSGLSASAGQTRDLNKV